jgi:hypothetical protein
MHSEPFVGRVQALRESWEERRQLRSIAGLHDYASQLRLIQAMHGWAEEAVEEIRTVYGGAVSISLSPCPEAPPDHREVELGFAVMVEPRFSAVFVLHDRRRAPGPSWGISVSVASDGAGATLLGAGLERRNGQWSRARMEGVLLSLLGAYERHLAAEEESPRFKRGY